MLDISNIDHVGIRVADREKSVAFYELSAEQLADIGVVREAARQEAAKWFWQD